MSVICFVTYEIHPATPGGCGVLLHHAAELLLREGHEVVFLLSMPKSAFDQFLHKDRPEFTNAERCRAHHVEALAEDFALKPEQCPSRAVWESLRFAHAMDRFLRLETPDFVEFFEYCGVSYATLVRRLFGRESTEAGTRRPILGSRLHNSLELIDRVGSTRYLDLARYHLYALERAGLRLSETILTPTRTYFDRHYRDAYSIPPQKAVVSQSPKLPFPRVTRRPDPRSERFTIAYVGRMFQFKGVDQLVHAAVELLTRRPGLQCDFDIIGPDASESPLGHSYREYLLTLVPAPLRDRFKFPGHLPQEQFARRLDTALFAVFPNKFESFCYALHEVYDAGVPVIVNDLPGFADFFHHERNAIVYDGRTDSLTAAMERLIDDHALREGLCRPYPIADAPLGNFYASPVAAEPLAQPTSDLPRVLAIVTQDSAQPGELLRRTVEALQAQRHLPDRVVVLVAASPDSEETFWWLGKPWHVRSPGGQPLNPEEIQTRDAAVVLRAGDLPSAEWLHACVTALSRRASLSFAGTWGRRSGQLVPSMLDLTPEAFPFEHGAARARAVIRTDPGRLLLDLFDPVLGNLGEIGYIWQNIERHGHGAMLQEPLIDVIEEPNAPPDPSLLKHLLSRYAGPLAPRLALYSGLLHERVEAISSLVRQRAGLAEAARPIPMISNPSLEHKIAMADELGGKTLVRLAVRKLTRRIQGRTPQP